MTDHETGDERAAHRAQAAAERRKEYGPRGSRDAKGPHIRDVVPHAPPSAYEVTPTDPDVDPQALSIQVDALTDMLSKFMMGVNNPKPDGADVAIPKPRFDGTINTGNILVLVTLLLGGFAGWGTYSADMAKRDARVEALQEVLRQNTTEIAKVRAEGEARAAKYAPMIEVAARANDVQDDRMKALSTSVQQLRDVVQDLAKLAAQTDRSLAVWIAQHAHEVMPGPHDR